MVMITAVLSGFLSLVEVNASEKESMAFPFASAGGTTDSLITINNDHIEHSIIGSTRTVREIKHGRKAKQQRRRMKASSSSSASNRKDVSVKSKSSSKKTKSSSSSSKKKKSKSTKDSSMIKEPEKKQEQELDTCNMGCSSGTTDSNDSNTESGATDTTNQTDADFVEDKDIIPSSSPTRTRTAVPSISPVTQTNKEGGGVISDSPTLQPSSSETFSTSSLVSHPPSSDGAMNLVEVSFGSIFISVSLPARISSRRRIRRTLATSVRDLKDSSSSSTVAVRNKLLTQQRATLESAEVDALQTAASTVCIDAFSQKYGSDFNSCDVTLHRSITIADDNLNQNEQQQSGESLLVLHTITGSVWFQEIQQPQDRQQEQHTSSLLPPTQGEATRYLAMMILESKAFLTLLVETSNKTMPSPPQSTANITIATTNATNTNYTNFQTIVLNSTVAINAYYHFDGEEGESATFIDDDYDIDDDSRNGASTGLNITTTPSPSSLTNSPGTAAAGDQEAPPSKRRSRTSQKRQRIAIMISIIFILLLLLALMIHVKFKLCFHILFGRCLGYCPCRCRGSCCFCCCCCCSKKQSPSSYSTSSPPAPPSYSSCNLLPSSGRRVIFGAGNITSTHRHRPSMTPSSISFVYLDDDDDGNSSPASSTTTATTPNVTMTNTTSKNHHGPSYCKTTTSSSRSRYYKNNNDDDDDDGDDDSSNNHSLHLWSKWNDIRYKKRRTTNYYKRKPQRHGETTQSNRSNGRSKRDTPSSNTTSSMNGKVASGASSSITSITTTNSPLKNIKFQNVFDLEQEEDHGSSRGFDQVWEGSIV